MCRPRPCSGAGSFPIWPRISCGCSRRPSGLAIASALSLVFPAVIQRVIDSVFTDADIALLDTITLALLAVFILRSLASFVQNYNLNYVGEKIVVDIRCQLYAHFQTLSIGYFNNKRVGELISRISSDVTVVRTVLTSNISAFLQQTLTLVGSVAIMFYLNWRLTLFIIVLMPIIVAVAFVLGSAIRRASTRVQDEIAGATVVAEEVLQNIREVKSFVRENYEVARYNAAIEIAFRAAVKLLTIRSIFGPIIAFFAFAGLALILWFGGREVLDGRAQRWRIDRLSDLWLDGGGQLRRRHQHVFAGAGGSGGD